MLYDAATEKDLRPWLKRTLEPICDAEPEVLAKYVLALLQHDLPEPELRNLIVTQLDAFLDKETASFVDVLFSTLRTKSYLPYQTSDILPSSSRRSVSPDSSRASIQHHRDRGSYQRSRKRSLEQDERDRELDRDSRAPPKGPRLSAENWDRYPQNHGDGYVPPTGRYGRWSNDNPDRAYGDGWRGHRSGTNGPMTNSNPAVNGIVMNGNGSGRGMISNGAMRTSDGRGNTLRRGMCRDYHNLGFCSRGATCPYSHGDDAVIPTMPFVQSGGSQMNPLAPGMAFIPGLIGPAGFPMSAWPMANGAGVPAGYDPNESKLDITGASSPLASSSLLTPMMSGNTMLQPHNRAPPTTSRNEGQNDQVMHDMGGELPVIQDLTPRTRPQPHASSVERSSPPIGESKRGSSQPRGGQRSFGGRGGGGRPGTFRDPHGGLSGPLNSSTTLVLEKIPQEHLSLPAISTFFSRFGTVTNVAISPADSKALVSFATHEEAQRAWKSEEAVFGNRFVKVYWHRPLEGQGKYGEKALKESADTVRNLTSGASNPQSTTNTPPLNNSRTFNNPKPTSGSSATSNTPTSIQSLKEHQQLLERQIVEQKSLMERLTKASTDEKKDIMTRLRKLGEEMKGVSTAGPNSTTTSGPLVAKKNPTLGDTGDADAKERERLDRELEMHSVQEALKAENDSAAGLSTVDGNTTADLQAKLASLRAEAASLGIPTDTSAIRSIPYSAPYRPYRGRGRGVPRGFYRGGHRGGVPAGRPNMQLDNRPRKMLVKGLPAGDEDAAGTVRGWYQASGDVESVDSTAEGLVVHFKTRAAAEQALAQGTQIPGVGSLQLLWYSAPPIASLVISSPTPTEDTRSDFGVDGLRLSPPLEERRRHRGRSHDDDEEGGWGRGADDEDDEDDHIRRRR